MNQQIISRRLEDIHFSSEREYLFREKRKERAGLCILIVDDQLFSRQLLVEALRLKWNYETIATKNGAQAMEVYLENAPDLVFLDIELPDYNGQDLLKKIKEIDKEAFVVMTTANTSIEDVQKAVSNGASGFIAKPITKSKLEQYFSVYVDKINKK
jgi:two-component system chemotaxis response regulator CheY